MSAVNLTDANLLAACGIPYPNKCQAEEIKGEMIGMESAGSGAVYVGSTSVALSSLLLATVLL